MEDSILTSIKKILGIASDYDVFDLDIIAAINTAFMLLWQLGIGPQSAPFIISGDEEAWTDFIETGKVEMCKTYVALRVRLLFDPPSSSFLVDALNKQAAEFEWRMTVAMDEYNAAEEDS